MKRLFYLLSLIIIASACTKDPEDTTGNIMGIVTESGSGTTPLAGVSVSITSNGQETSTGSNGQFSFYDLEAKTYTLQFMKEGYETNKRTVTVISGQDTNCDIQLIPEKKEADIRITPSSLNFGTTQTEMSVTITNNGKAETEWTLELGNNPWLTANPPSGRIASKKTQSIIFSVNRDKLPEAKSVVVNLSAFGNSFPVSISCAPKNSKSEMKVEPTTLDFGDASRELTITIKNTGDATLNWDITNLTVDCLSLSETRGAISSEGSQVVKVTLNRETMPDVLNTSFIISDGTKQEAVTVKGSKAKAMMSVSPLTLDFGEEATELPFNISNTGNAELDWTITQVSESCLSVSTTTGKVPAQGTTKLTVTLNRETMPKTLNATITVSDGNRQETVAVTGTKASDVAGLVVPQGLYTYYKFDGTYEDATENAIHGFGNNSPTFVTGVTSGSQAVKFSKTNNSSFVVPKPIIDSRKMTVCFWGKDFSDGNIFYMVSSIQNTPMFTASISGGSLKFIVTRYNNVYEYVKTGTFVHPTLTDGKWHHIALTSDFNDTTYSTVTTTLYVDGQAVDVVTEDANVFGEAAGSGQASYGTGIKFIMGGSVKLSSSRTLTGTNMSVDNLRVYDTRKLSAEEIKSIYNAKQ